MKKPPPGIILLSIAHFRLSWDRTRRIFYVFSRELVRDTKTDKVRYSHHPVYRMFSYEDARFLDTAYQAALVSFREKCREFNRNMRLPGGIPRRTI
jgi:hypothetical protein